MSTKKNETEWDKKLKIQTNGRDDYGADQYHFPYEPTPYVVLVLFGKLDDAFNVTLNATILC